MPILVYSLSFLVALFSFCLAFWVPFNACISEWLASDSTPVDALDAQKSQAAYLALLTFAVAPTLGLMVGVTGGISGNFIFEQVKGGRPGELASDWRGNIAENPVWVIVVAATMVLTLFSGAIVARVSLRDPADCLWSYEQVLAEAERVSAGIGSLSKAELGDRIRTLDASRSNRAWRRSALRLRRLRLMPNASYSREAGYVLPTDYSVDRRRSWRVLRNCRDGRFGLILVVFHAVSALILVPVFGWVTLLALLFNFALLSFFWWVMVRVAARANVLQLSRRCAVRWAAIRAVGSLS